MPGPCAKRQVVCTIVGINGARYIGENDCANPQKVCPRLEGEGYEKCTSVCQQVGHAETEALKKAGMNARGGHATLFGHHWICEPCGRALSDAGVASVTIVYP